MLNTQTLLQVGGPVVWLLLLFSVVAVTLVLAKSWQLWRVGRMVKNVGMEALSFWKSGDDMAAISTVQLAKQPALQLLQSAFIGQQQCLDESSLREELERRLLSYSDQLRSGLRPLELIGGISPLLGLLGTVFGMIIAFQQMEQAGNQIDPSVLSGGIWQALLTTAAGLMVAIPVVLLHNWLDQWVYRLLRQMQDLVTAAFTTRAVNVEPKPQPFQSAEKRTDTLNAA